MFGKKQAAPVPSIVSQDAAQMLPGARRAGELMREAMREYPALWQTDEYHALMRTLGEMTGNLEDMSGKGATHV